MNEPQGMFLYRLLQQALQHAEDTTKIRLELLLKELQLQFEEARLQKYKDMIKPK